MKCLIEEQPESDSRKELIGIVETKINDEYTLASLSQDPSKVGFEIAERFLPIKVEGQAQKLPEI